jgi:hypothetical protein
MDSILNSLHKSDDLETESYMSEVTMSYALGQTDLIGDGEQSCTCSQVLGEMTAEPQSIIATDKTTTYDYKLGHQAFSVPELYQPHQNDVSITTAVYFEFPQHKK